MIHFFSYEEAKRIHEERVARAMARHRRKAAKRRFRGFPGDIDAELIEVDFGLGPARTTKLGA